MHRTLALATLALALSTPLLAAAGNPATAGLKRADDTSSGHDGRLADRMPRATVSISPEFVRGRHAELGFGISARLRATPFSRARYSPALVIKGSIDHDSWGEEHASIAGGVDLPLVGDAHQGLSLGPRIGWHDDAFDTRDGSRGYIDHARGLAIGAALTGQQIFDNRMTLGGTLDVQQPVGAWPTGSPVFVRVGFDVGVALGGDGAYPTEESWQGGATVAGLGGIFLSFLGVGLLAAHCNRNDCLPASWFVAGL